MARILIADDEEKIRALVIKYAQFEGHETREARDGLEAVAAAEREPFDLMILDVMMPGLDGFSACREIRKHCDTPILMLSARGEEYDRIHGFEAGVDDYVVKPFSPRELMLRVGAILKRNAKGDRADALLDQLQDDEFATYLEDAAQGGDMCVHVINADGRTVAATNRYRDCAVHRMGVSDLRRIFLETRAAGGAQTRRFTMPAPDAAMQGTGLGSRLAGEAAAYLRAQGYTKLRLGVDRGNPQSLSFWRKNGFAQVSEGVYIAMERALVLR